MKKNYRVRILLRVSSNQQLEADGDLSIQRSLVHDYISRHDNWLLDEKEYFEGSNSGYKNSVSDRDILQEILDDAKANLFDILVVYKDDRLGRRMWEIGAYVMELKKHNVDIFSVKEGCISPDTNDIMGQMMLALRYGNAQKSSSDTGQRVKDTAQKLVKAGKFIGGRAPYGYRLEYSGEISKHGRALKHLVINSEEAEMVKYIFYLSHIKEYGSSKIAKSLNEDSSKKKLAPDKVWKSSTITSILTNPIYTGRIAYNRRTRINDSCHRLDSSEWILSDNVNPNIKIISEETWNETSQKRYLRSQIYAKHTDTENAPFIKGNDSNMTLADVIYCGYCNSKLISANRYSYWTIKKSKEKKSCKIPVYKCPNFYQDGSHENTIQYRAAKIEAAIISLLADCIEVIFKNDNIQDEIFHILTELKNKRINELRIAKEKQTDIQRKIDILNHNIPNAMNENYPLSLVNLVNLINSLKNELEFQKKLVIEKELELYQFNKTIYSISYSMKQMSWKDIFSQSDKAVKRVLVNRLISRIDITKEEISIHFKINFDVFLLCPPNQ